MMLWSLGRKSLQSPLDGGTECRARKLFTIQQPHIVNSQYYDGLRQKKANERDENGKNGKKSGGIIEMNHSIVVRMNNE